MQLDVAVRNWFSAGSSYSARHAALHSFNALRTSWFAMKRLRKKVCENAERAIANLSLSQFALRCMM
jgi:hypothetical protein